MQIHVPSRSTCVRCGLLQLILPLCLKFDQSDPVQSLLNHSNMFCADYALAFAIHFGLCKTAAFADVSIDQSRPLFSFGSGLLAGLAAAIIM